MTTAGHRLTVQVCGISVLAWFRISPRWNQTLSLHRCRIISDFLSGFIWGKHMHKLSLFFLSLLTASEKRESSSLLHKGLDFCRCLEVLCLLISPTAVNVLTVSWHSVKLLFLFFLFPLKGTTKTNTFVRTLHNSDSLLCCNFEASCLSTTADTASGFFGGGCL